MYIASDYSQDDELLTHAILGRRIAAWLADVCIIGVVWTFLWLVLTALGLATFGLGFVLLGLLPFVPLIYGAWFIASPLSATPGQALFGLAVRRQEDLGRPDLFRAALATGLFYATWWGSLLLQILAILPITARRRMLHDILSITVVVHARVLRDMTLTDRPDVPNMGRWNRNGSMGMGRDWPTR